MTDAERKHEIVEARKLLNELEAMLHYQIVKAKSIRQRLENLDRFSEMVQTVEEGGALP